MSVSIICGGQFGSEGKGKVAYYLCNKYHAMYHVRVGGSNSGHTVYSNGVKYMFRCLPSGVLESDTVAILPAGSYIDIDLLFKEIKIAGISLDSVKIDHNAVIVSSDEMEEEYRSDLGVSIASTLSGTGAAVKNRILRNPSKVRLASDDNRINTVDTKYLMRCALNKCRNIVIEGSQGYGLSVLHSEYYPYVTSRDITASGILSECGLSPFDVENVVMVLRTYPIRVGGNSGPLKNELSWSDVANRAGYSDLIEYTSCTNRIRRVGAFDDDIVKQAIMANSPNIIVMNHLDYIDASVLGKTKITDKCKNFISQVEADISRKINMVGTGVETLIEL